MCAVCGFRWQPASAQRRHGPKEELVVCDSVRTLVIDHRRPAQRLRWDDLRVGQLSDS